jgi:curved DNA-binding protein CbpA
MRRCQRHNCSRHLRTLGLDPQQTYSDKDLKDAFRAKAKTSHPDVAGGNAASFQAVHAAYSALRHGDQSEAAYGGWSAQSSYAAGNEEVYRRSSQTTSAWNPEQTAQECRAPLGEDETIKWFTFRQTSGDATRGFSRMPSEEEKSQATRDFYNPYGGRFTGSNGHQGDGASTSTKSFYRPYTSSKEGFTPQEIRLAEMEGRRIIARLLLTKIIVPFLCLCAVYRSLTRKDNKVNIARAETESGTYSAGYLSTLPDRTKKENVTKQQEAQSEGVDYSAHHASVSANQQTQRLSSSYPGEDMEPPERVEAAPHRKEQWAQHNADVMSGKNPFVAARRRQQPRGAVAATFQGKPFTAEGLQELREERRAKQKAAAAAGFTAMAEVCEGGNQPERAGAEAHLHDSKRKEEKEVSLVVNDVITTKELPDDMRLLWCVPTAEDGLVSCTDDTTYDLDE